MTSGRATMYLKLVIFYHLYRMRHSPLLQAVDLLLVDLQILTRAQLLLQVGQVQVLLEVGKLLQLTQLLLQFLASAKGANRERGRINYKVTQDQNSRDTTRKRGLLCDFLFFLMDRLRTIA